MLFQIEWKCYYGQGRQKRLQTRIKILGLPIIIITYDIG